MSKSRPKAYSVLLTKQNKLPALKLSHLNWYTNLLRKIVVSTPEYKDGKRYQEVAIHYNGVGIIRRADSRRNGRILPRTHQQKAFLKGKNGIATKLYRIHTTIFN